MSIQNYTYRSESRVPSLREVLLHEHFRSRMLERKDIKFFPRIHMEYEGEMMCDQPTLYYQKDGITYIIDARDEAVDYYADHPSFVYVHYRSNTHPEIPLADQPMLLIPPSQRVFFCEEDVHFVYDLFRSSHLVGFLPQNHSALTYRVLMKPSDPTCAAIVFKSALEIDGETVSCENILYLRANGEVSMVDSFKRSVHLLGHIVPA